MTNKTVCDEMTADTEQQRLLEQEMFILEATECIARIMEKEDVSKADLAAKLGKSKAFVTQVLNGGRNMTMRTIADILFVLGYQAKIKAEPINKKSVSKLIHINWPRRNMFDNKTIKFNQAELQTPQKSEIAV